MFLTGYYMRIICGILQYMLAPFCFLVYNPGAVETISVHNRVVSTWLAEVASFLPMFVPFLSSIASA
jgi:hypothetical protein